MKQTTKIQDKLLKYKTKLLQDKLIKTNLCNSSHCQKMRLRIQIIHHKCTHYKGHCKLQNTIKVKHRFM